MADEWGSLKALARYATGEMNTDARDYIPGSDIAKAIFAARGHLANYAATIIVALAMRSVLPLMLIGLPRLYGCWHMYMTGLIKHGGLAEDVVDHRLNSRTCLMNPLSRWIYWNMNYHIEHHMFPMVPYHALPCLHGLIKDDLPAPCPSILAAFAEMIQAVLRQRREPGYCQRKALPPSARPYREELHREAPDRTSMGV